MTLSYSIARATQRLNDLGFKAGAVSNTPGPMFKAAVAQFQQLNGLATTGYGTITEAALFSSTAVRAGGSNAAGPLKPITTQSDELPSDYRYVGKEAGDIIVESEVTSPATYKRKYSMPTWPGGDSGVTVAIGIDLGYATVQSISTDWGSRLPAQMVALMQQCAGAKGPSAQALVASGRFRSVEITWDVAIEHFINVELPRWVSKVRAVFPNTAQLGPDCEGALVSLAFNRGLSLVGDSRVEMLHIRNYLRDGRSELVPAEFRSMKRLWVGKNLDGLLTRREAEARLFERGLAKLGR